MYLYVDICLSNLSPQNLFFKTSILINIVCKPLPPPLSFFHLTSEPL